MKPYMATYQQEIDRHHAALEKDPAAKAAHIQANIDMVRSVLAVSGRRSAAVDRILARQELDVVALRVGLAS